MKLWWICIQSEVCFIIALSDSRTKQTQCDPDKDNTATNNRIFFLYLKQEGDWCIPTGKQK